MPFFGSNTIICPISLARDSEAFEIQLSWPQYSSILKILCAHRWYAQVFSALRPIRVLKCVAWCVSF